MSQSDAPICVHPEPAAEWRKQLDSAKRRERSELKLHEWTKYGFGTTRAEDFERLAASGDFPPGCVPRIHHSELSVEDFFERFERQGLPVTIAGVPEAQGWPAWPRWTWQDLCRRFASVSFKVGKDDSGDPIKVRLGHFATYMAGQRDDSPLYVFDSSLGGSRGGTRRKILEEYSVPPYFPDDFMAMSGEDGRPPYRWLLIGPKRSGTPVHTDPLVTSAWNTLLRGRKRWALMPPGTARKVAKARGVMKKGDDDEAVNYFCDLIPRLREQGHEVLEFVQYPGDTVFVPGNWWHCVVNLEDTVAVTQNYCGRNNFKDVWRCSRVERPCWAHKWLQGMAAAQPDLAAWARALNAEDGFDMGAMLQYNNERRRRRRCRRDWRALRAARTRHRRRVGRSGPPFDEGEFLARRRELPRDGSSDSRSSSNSDSTVSTSTSETDSSSTSSSSDSSSDSSSSADVEKVSPQRMPAPGS